MKIAHTVSVELNATNPVEEVKQALTALSITFQSQISQYDFFVEIGKYCAGVTSRIEQKADELRQQHEKSNKQEDIQDGK